MTTTTIHCDKISKSYRIGRQLRSQTLRETMFDTVTAPFRRLRTGSSQPAGVDGVEPRILWALSEVSLDLKQGEVLGIVGNNGSGKSTLMKILSRITRPDSGHAEICGRVGTLLEVGTGFHQQLTGRENVYLSGAVLGMKRREIARKFDEIVEFSECGQMLDTPLKHYSTGMKVRLAFAVAAHLEAEILLVDEVLAVGDANFQKKCLGKIGDVASQGRTVLFTSHNLLAIDSLCTRAICMHLGKMVLEGTPNYVTSSYLKQWMPTATEVVFDDPDTVPSNDLIRLRRISVHPYSGGPNDPITVRTPFIVEFDYERLTPHLSLDLRAEVFDEYEIHIFSTGKLRDPAGSAGIKSSSFLVPGDLMNNGVYRINLGVYLGTERHYWKDLLVFEVQDAASELRGSNFDAWPGAVRPHLQWVTRDIQPAAVSRSETKSDFEMQPGSPERL